MIEFGLPLGGGVIVLIAAMFFGRALLGRAAALRVVTSTYSTMLGSTRLYLGAHDRTLAVFISLVAACGFIGFGVVRSHGPADPAATSYGLAAWLTVGLLLGAGSSAAATHLAAVALNRALPRIDENAKRTASHAFVGAVRSAGAAILVAIAILLLTVTLLAASAYGSANGFDTDAGFHRAARAATLAVSAYALGTVLASLVAHNMGGIFLSGVLGGSSSNSMLERVLAISVTRINDLFATIAVALAACAVIGVASGPPSPSAHAPAALAAWPLIALTFALLSSAVGIAVVRTDGSEPVRAAVDRGLAVTMILNAASFVGLAFWLFPGSWWRLLLAAWGGLLGATLVLWIERRAMASVRRLDRQVAPGTGSVPTSGFALRAAAAAIFVSLATALLGFLAGRSTGLAHAGPLGLAFAISGMLAPAPFVLTTAAVAALSHRPPRRRENTAEPTTQIPRWNGAPVDPVWLPRVYAAVCMAMATWTAVPAFTILASPAHAPSLDDLGWTLVAASSLVGVMLVAWVAGASLRAISAVTPTFHPPSSSLPPKGNGALPLQGDRAESGVQRHAAVLQAAVLQAALRHGIPMMLLMMAAPLVTWGILRLVVGTGPASGVLAAATAGLVLSTSFAGLTLSSAASAVVIDWRVTPFGHASGHGTAMARDNAVDVSEKLANNRPDGAAVVGDTLGRSFQSLTVPCIHALVKLFAAAALALAPLFF